MIDTPFFLGAVKRQKRKTDYHPDSFGSVGLIPDRIDAPLGVIYNQGQYPTCGAHAGASSCNSIKGDTTSPKYLWKNIKSIDGLPFSNGTDLLSLLKSWKNIGICSLSLLDDSLETSIEDYSSVKEITPIMNGDAMRNTITGYAFIDNPSMDSIRNQIALHKSVILLIKCGSGWWTDKNGVRSFKEQDILPLRLGNYVSGHFINCDGYDEEYIYFKNSFGLEWGRNGVGYFDENYIDNVIEMGIPIFGRTFIFTQNLCMGMTSADVHALQVKLNMPKEYQTGFFGSKTFKAVQAYQSANGITPTGFVGSITRASLSG